MSTGCYTKKTWKFSAVLFILLVLVNPDARGQVSPEIPGFTTSPYFDEQVATFRLKDDITLHINAPAVDSFRVDKPMGLALYALPNGNTIEHTVGKVLETGDDWHYDIQHIGAQTRFLRQLNPDYNLVTVYLEASQLSWPAWTTNYPNYDDIIRETVAYLMAVFQEYSPFVVLTGHSGGGRFIFDYLDGVSNIPDEVKRICFLDSNYGYDNTYGAQFVTWLNGAPDRFLSVIAYNDSVALYNGEPIVSPTGGTWYRSRMMQQYLAQFYSFTTQEDDDFIRHYALDNRIEIVLKKNPNQEILHTVQVERNGFIHTMVTGTEYENSGYTYYDERAYADLVQTGVLARPSVQIPLRRADAMNGSQFMNAVTNMSLSQRENAILDELYTGNVPYFLRGLKTLAGTFQDAGGTSHDMTYRVMPDYLSIGADSNYCRIPMGPITAQRIADFYGMFMPTRKLVNYIWTQADVHLAPVTYAPVGNENELVPKFVEHNTAIEAQLVSAGASLGDLIGGTKKDVVLSNLIIDPNRPDHVTIYGWHQLNGTPIQSLTNIHVNTYVDYSHGIRFLDRQVSVDNVMADATVLLRNPIQYALLSDESGHMVQPTYIPDGSLPARPISFGIFSENPGEARVIIEPDDNIQQYHLYTSGEGLTFDEPLLITTNTYTLDDLAPDSLLFIKLVAENASGVSNESEVLAALPSGPDENKVLLVNGFDRTSAGNTFNFVRQHGGALHENNLSFESVTNDAVLDGLVNLNDYLIVDYILGEESTVDETFSTTEQALVSAYLRQGGRLFVSGAEIAWDLDYRGSTGDKSFIHNYLKAAYSADAPGGVSGTYYAAQGIPGTIFNDVGTFTYDNGTHGTFNVRYPDALTAINGSENIVSYQNVVTHNIGGVSFDGLFPGGTAPGMVVYLGIPFETIYPAASRNAVMSAVIDYLMMMNSVQDGDKAKLPSQFELTQNYPNPFNPGTTLRFGLPESANVRLVVYDLRGRTVRTLIDNQLSPGWHKILWNGRDDMGMEVSAGIYFARLQGGGVEKSVKMTVLK